jgi:ATP-dependent DNA helicase RecQ
MIAETQDGYPVLLLNELSWQVLRGERPVQLAVAAKPAPRVRTDSSPATDHADGGALFESLRSLRKQLADEVGMPPYVIFHDATLREIAQKRPLTLSQFAGIRGVGEAKLARYGERFIAAVRSHPNVAHS